MLVDGGRLDLGERLPLDVVAVENDGEPAYRHTDENGREGDEGREWQPGVVDEEGGRSGPEHGKDVYAPRPGVELLEPGRQGTRYEADKPRQEGEVAEGDMPEVELPHAGVFAVGDGIIGRKERRRRRVVSAIDDRRKSGHVANSLQMR